MNNQKSANTYKSILKDAGVFAIGSLGSKIITFLFVPLYTACLTTVEYGISDVLQTSVSLIFPILTMAISEAVLRFCYDKDVPREKILSISLSVIGVATIANILFTLLLSAFVSSIKQYIVYYLIIFTLSALEHSLANFLKGQEKTKLYALNGIVHTAALVISNIVFLLVLRSGLNGYFYSMIIGYVISILFMVISGKMYRLRVSIKLDVHLLKQMLIYSLPMVPATIAWWINSSSDKYMITWMVGAGANGIYSVAHKIPTIITTVTGMLTQAWQISAMKNHKTEEYSELFSNIINGVNCVLISSSVLVIALCRIVAKFLFQNDFYVAWKYVPLLILAANFSTIAGLLASAYTSAKKTNILFISTCIAAVFNIVVNFALINLIGTIGAAIATVGSFLVMVIIRFVIMQKHIVKLSINLTLDTITYVILFAESLLVAYFENYFYYIVIPVSLLVLIINFKRIKKYSVVILGFIKKKKS